MTDEHLWSTRCITEYAYCPRLFYFMQVEGIAPDTFDTEKGNVIHRHVDKQGESHTNNHTIAYSLTLTSEKLKLTARLDIAEISDTIAVPVEYRKGKPKHNSDDDNNWEPWPTDCIQVALQALLLEEAGYKVTEAFIYYAEIKRKLAIPIDNSLKQKAIETYHAAVACSKGARPEPLLHSSKCPRCSLQPFCLPDEINLQRAQKITEKLTPRKIWPLRDDGIHLVVQSYAATVGIKQKALKVTNIKTHEIKEIPLSQIESLLVLGPVQVTTQAVTALAARNIPIAYLSSAGRLIAIIEPVTQLSANIKKAQIRRFDNPTDCLMLAQALVTAKITNQRTILLRNTPSTAHHDIKKIKTLIHDAANAKSFEALRGIEGYASKIYFKHFPQMLSGSLAKQFAQNGRKRRPPPDPINSCLSMGYTMLAHECTTALRLAHLDPAVGAYHVSRPGRPAFSLDLMEPFRPLIADSVVITAFNKNELSEKHFYNTPAGCLFTPKGRKAFFNTYGRRMNVFITHPVFGYRLEYRRMIMLHARMIAAWLLREIKTLEFLTTR